MLPDLVSNHNSSRHSLTESAPTEEIIETVQQGIIKQAHARSKTTKLFKQGDHVRIALRALPENTFFKSVNNKLWTREIFRIVRVVEPKEA